MHQPVDQGRGHGVVHIKDFAPFPEGSIRGDHDRSNFITGGDNLEQQIGPALVDGQIAQLIERKKTRKHETLDAYALMYRYLISASDAYPARTGSQFPAARPGGR